MMTDRLTARVLGMLLLSLTLLIDVSALMFTKPEARTARLAAVVIIPSLPLLAFGAVLLWRAARLKEHGDP